MNKDKELYELLQRWALREGSENDLKMAHTNGTEHIEDQLLADTIEALGKPWLSHIQRLPPWAK